MLSGAEVMHDDRLDDLLVSTQDIVYVGAPDGFEVVLLVLPVQIRLVQYRVLSDLGQRTHLQSSVVHRSVKGVVYCI